jgi:hypothetical protein
LVIYPAPPITSLKIRFEQRKTGEKVESIHPARHTVGHVSGKGGRGSMANHLTPTELARESGLERRDVIAKCIEMGVPIFNGRIDKTLFLCSLRESPETQKAQLQPASA